MDNTYMARTLESIRVQCEARGIPSEELEKVRAHIEEKMDKPVEEMVDVELKRLNQALPHLMEDYLGGMKRRPRVRVGGSGNAESVEGSMEVITPEDVATVDAKDLGG